MRAVEDTIQAIAEVHRRYNGLIVALALDVNSANDILRENPSQFNRRQAVRTSFAYIEAGIYSLKQITLVVHDTFGATFTDAELALLAEQSFELNEAGKAKTQVKFLKLASNLRFAFSCYARAFDCNYTLNVTDGDWNCFLNLINIRNRLTHPKILSDIDVSDDDLKNITKAFNWYQKSLTGLIDETILKFATILRSPK
ncbi:MAG: hypothetical protein WBV94_02765 [Blastocatellia bacterium]